MIGLFDSKVTGKMPDTLNSVVDWNDTQQLNAYGMLSANLFNFLPQIPFDKHVGFYQSYRLQQALNGNDIRLFEDVYPLPVLGWDKLENLLHKQNGIIATYHFGPFQLINYLLVKSEIPFALLVGAETMAVWEKRYPELIQVMEQARLKNRFQLLKADDPSSLRLMYRLLREGYNLLIYVDGLEGAEQIKEKQGAAIHFLGQQITVPKGAAMLANYFQLPIYPVLLRRNKNHIHVELDRIINSEKIPDRSSFVQVATDRLYAFLSRYIMHWPDQWTLWSMLHRFLLKECLLHNEENVASAALMERYGLISMGNKGYLLEKASYRIYALDKNDFNRLKNSLLEE